MADKSKSKVINRFRDGTIDDLPDRKITLREYSRHNQRIFLRSLKKVLDESKNIK